LPTSWPFSWDREGWFLYYGHEAFEAVLSKIMGLGDMAIRSFASVAALDG